MENRIDLHLAGGYSIDTLKSAIINGLCCEFVIDQLQSEIRKYTKDNDLDLNEIYEEFRVVIENGENVTFSRVSEWANFKASIYKDILMLVNKLDAVIAENQIITQGELIGDFRRELTNFLLSLTELEITGTFIDFNAVGLKREYLDKTLEDLVLVDEGQFLSDLSVMKIDATPLDVAKFKNSVVENKLRQANAIADNVKTLLENDFVKLHNKISTMHDKFYAIVYDTLTDGEKNEKARKVIKGLSSHRRVLDKLEDKLTEANELKRQLIIHDKKIKDNLEIHKTEAKNRIKDNPELTDMINIELNSLDYVSKGYITRISNVVNKINSVENDITNNYKILDKLEANLKYAIPMEEELKRYSSLAYKYQELLVKLEVAKSQLISKENSREQNKDTNSAIKTAVTGLSLLVNISKECKDLFVRNNLLMALFNSVNVIYDIVDNPNKSIEISQIKFVTSRLSEYSILNANLNKELVSFRQIANNTIRDIAITMGKPIDLNGIADIIDSIELTSTRLEQILEGLKNNHTNQTKILNEILNI